MILRISHFIIGFSTIVILALIISNKPQKIKIRFVIQLLIIEIACGYFILNSQLGSNHIQKIFYFFNHMLHFSLKGTEFIFGGMHDQGLANFFLNVLCPITFISALIGILQYTRILGFLIKVIGTILSKVNGMNKLESFNAISSLFLGQSENFIIYKNMIEHISEKQIYTMAITAMSTVSLSIVGSYMTILNPKYVITALILNMFSTFIIISLLNPYSNDMNQNINISKYCLYFNQKSFFEIIGDYILIGFKIAMTITAMLIGFIALIAAMNELFKLLFNISFQETLSYLFYPIAWIIGIPFNEIMQASNIMATKLITNEFVAIIDLQKISHTLSSRSISILSIFLVSFANFSSIGIITGAIKNINKIQGEIVARQGFKLIYSATLINLLSASIANLVIDI